MLLHRERKIGAAFDSGVVGHDHHFAPRDAADSCNEAGARRLAVVVAEGGESRKLEKRRAGIEEPGDPFAHEKLAALFMFFTRFHATTLSG